MNVIPFPGPAPKRGNTMATTTTPERKLLGQVLKKMRSAAGLTQKELAARLGIEYYTFISQIEGGQARIPPEQTEGYADALDVDRVEFAKMCLSYYDPALYKAIFGPLKQPITTVSSRVRN